MTENIFIAILVLQEEKTIPAGWDQEDQGPWPWRHINISPYFATHNDNDGYNFMQGFSMNGVEPEKFFKDISTIHCNDISKEAEKIKEEIQKQYSGEIQILWR